MTSIFDTIDTFLEASRPRAEAFLAELVKVPSDNPKGDCAPLAARTKELLEDLGLPVEVDLVPASVVQANGMVSASNLIVRRKFGDGPTIALNAHGDVVPPGEGWTKDPYGAEVVDGVMYGRGVAVSKSDFATYTFALLALQEVAGNIAGTVELHFTYDEEAGGEIGPKRLLETGLSRPDLAIGAGFAYSVVTAHNGCLHLGVELLGRSAHAARPDTGFDALEAANGVLTALYASRKSLQTRRSKVKGIEAPTLVVGLISGGINTNVVPDRVLLRLDRRMIPEEVPDDVEAELRRLIESAAQKYPGISVRIRRILLARPLTQLPGATKLIEALVAQATEVMGIQVASAGIPLYTDGRHYAEAGVPCVLYGAGPRDLLEANAHRADEKLVLADLHAATRVVARSLASLLIR
ncbi:MAG TPA: M20/M25/M40 family metallo-hydrolase [Geminicoccus sp.]|jgi:acetylornithine deacetylase/succinyl-diaminopimelate desuccinylase-like protein|uniref:M20/M25/M40 family metallo-hydrolase n=1 Tax=Geminicoccus sp. TaxID=2024832 RepID=UPI002E30CE33|nr:M20/M25/M40 family metallo-hydrolase [Geminicoccus sp.]HEX2527559.1 M20/M25/M40 family metallo-hydrolase [Geminicoccus sp.]